MQKPSPELAALAGKRVLICEDEGITIMQLSRMVARAGLVVAGVASTGPQAVEFALRDRPEIILLDLRLSGMNGLEVIRQITDVYHPCIIALVARSDEVRAAAEAGATASVIKPADTADLLKALPECVKRFTHAVVKEPESAPSESIAANPST